MEETARMRDLLAEIRRLEMSGYPWTCEACNTAYAAWQARIEALTAEWQALHKAACADAPCMWCARQGELPDVEWDTLMAGE
jgi:hypothetical protein